MEYLGKSQAELETAGGYWTAKEILQQPAVWAETERLMMKDADALRGFLSPLVRRPELRIVLTGAGTSAFIGECLVPAMTRLGLRAGAVATTDLVGSPDSWLGKGTPILLVSFARSGNSPESVAALEMAEQAAPECHHLIVTCNREGALYRRGLESKRAHVVLLPPESNDRGFAMTSSFSGMLLAAALGFDLLSGLTAKVLGEWVRGIQRGAFALAEGLAHAGFERVVYLGSKECKALAREAALKLLELSDGRVVALSDTPLGFRHGPKTIVNGRTLVVMFLSNDPYTRRYEIDVLEELRNDGVAGRVIALSGSEQAHADSFAIRGAESAPDLGLCFPYAVFAQTLAFLQSLALGLRPDVPNAKGVVSRVVQPFAVHPWGAKR